MPDDDPSFERFKGVIAEHLGDLGEELNFYEADGLLRAAGSKFESALTVWKPEPEQDKIDRVRHLLGELSSAIDQLHPKVLTGIRLRALHEMIEGRPQAHDLMGLLMDAVATLSESLLAGTNIAKTGTAARSDLNLEAVSVIDACRRAWERRKKCKLPRSLNPASPFGKFVGDIFLAVGLDSDLESAMKAWSRLNAKL